jgi:hypothetical protein
MVGPGAFVRFAPRYREAGLIVYPCGIDGGKPPAIRGYNKSLFSRKTVEGWVARKQFRDANIGLSPGLNGFTVLDLDDPDQYRDCVDRFGHTPIQTVSPRGGRHLWYRNSGERCGDFRKKLGLEADLKGIGGHIVLPPSINFATGKPYRFDGCDFLDLRPEGLPSMMSGAIPETRKQANPKLNDPKPHREVREGERNRALFAIARSIAANATSFEEVMIEVLTANAKIPYPLSEGEAEKVAGSAWKLKLDGRCFVPGQEGQVIITKSLRVRLQSYPNALVLYLLLRVEHGARFKRGESFAFAPLKMAESAKQPGSTLPPWCHSTYRKAIKRLLDAGLVREVRPPTANIPGEYKLVRA